MASKLWKLICCYISDVEVFYTVILSNNLIYNKKEYRDILNIITYTLHISNSFSLQHALFSLQDGR